LLRAWLNSSLTHAPSRARHAPWRLQSAVPALENALENIGWEENIHGPKSLGRAIWRQKQWVVASREVVSKYRYLVDDPFSFVDLLLNPTLAHDGPLIPLWQGVS
jgi:hypothetical protein